MLGHQRRFAEMFRLGRIRLAVVALISFAAIVASWPGSAPPAAAAASKKAAWTLMLYIDADCDLEASTIEQLSHLTEVGGNKDVNVVLLVDRSAKDGDDADGYTDADLGNIENWTGAKLLLAKKDKFVEIADWGVVNLADPTTLARFATTAAQKYPAERYALVLGDHGAGWPGVCFDDSADDAGLTLPRLQMALNLTTRKIGKLELIGFDACLMATVETAHAVAPFAKYMVASEELVPGCGWALPPVMTALQEDPSVDGAGLGRIICDAFKAQFDDSDDEDDQNEGLEITMSVVDLSKIARLEKAVLALTQRGHVLIQQQQRQGWIKLAKVRARSREFGCNGGSDGFAYHDLSELARNYRTQDAGSAALCQALTNALKAAVVYSVHGDDVPTAAGLTIYFPRDGDVFDEEARQGYAQVPFAHSSRWGQFLERYVEQADDDEGKPQIDELTVSATTLTQGKGRSIKLATTIDADDIDRAHFVLAVKRGDKKVIMGKTEVEPDEEGTVRATWDGKWFAIGNKERWLTAPVLNAERVEGKEHDWVMDVPAQIKKKGRPGWIDVVLRFSVTMKEGSVKGRFVSAFTFTRYGPRQINVEPGDDLRAVYFQFDARGVASRLASDKPEEVLHLRKKGDLGVSTQPLSKGTYLLGFEVIDLSGNRELEDVAVTLK